MVSCVALLLLGCKTKPPAASTSSPEAATSVATDGTEPEVSKALTWESAPRRDPFQNSDEPVTPTTWPVPDDWVIHETKWFTFRAPEALKGKAGPGTDSYVGDYALASSLKLRFDYGWYSNPLNQEPDHISYSRRPAVVDGRTGYIVWCEYESPVHEVGRFAVGIFLQVKGTNKLQFSAYCADQATRQMAQAILMSVRFRTPH